MASRQQRVSSSSAVGVLQAQRSQGADSSEEQPDLNSWPYLDRRKTPDRRRRPTAWWDSLLGRHRRVRGRRKGESRSIYVDLYDHRDLILTLLIFSLNLIDALMTLVYLGQGGSEANPVMAKLLGYGVGAFVLEKCLVVALCLIALVVTRPLRWRALPPTCCWAAMACSRSTT